MPRILLFGAGAVGLTHAYILYKGGAEVTLVCRSNYEAILSNGITIASALLGNASFSLPAVKDCADAEGPWDFIVVCTKVILEAPKLIAQAVSAGTIIVLIQNGIEIEQPYRDAFPERPIISGVTYVPATQVRPGHVVVSSINLLELGSYPANANPATRQSLEAFADMIRNGGGVAKVVDDIQERRWLKVAINATWGPLCSLTLLDSHNYTVSSERSVAVANEVTEEITSIARARGYVGLDIKGLMAQFNKSRENGNSAGNEPSMLGDVRAGRQMEVEPIIGNALRIAREMKVDTPRLELLYVLCSGLNRALALNGREAQIRTTIRS